MFILTTDQELYTRELIDRIMGCDNSLDQKDILKFIYYFMILFITVYIFKYFLLVSFSHQESVVMFSF
jgi:polyphosphate kinase 2 (PPK2 family)